MVFLNLCFSACHWRLWWPRGKNMQSSKNFLYLSIANLATSKLGFLVVVCYKCVCAWGQRRGGKQLVNHFLQILPFWASCKPIALLFSSFDLCIGLLGFVSQLMAIGLDLARHTIKMLGDLHAVCWLSCILYRIILRWIVSVGLCSFVCWGSEVTSKTSRPAAWCDLWTPKGTRSGGYKTRHKH